MIAQHSNQFKHTTLTSHPLKVAGVSFVEERPGFTGVYLRNEEGGFWPAREVAQKPKKHHKSVCDAWAQHYGMLGVPECQMHKECKKMVTHIGERTRKMTPDELKLVMSGQPIAKF